jgi:putative hydroxymethylpyrimidine transporter CytX
MNNDKVSHNVTMFNFTCLWFGAAVSIAEIMAGGLLAPLGFTTGLWAIICGHVIGTTLLVLGGIIGTEERIPAIMSTRISFGEYGAYLFSLLNVLQLVGWTAVMIVLGARSVNQITKVLWSFDSLVFWGFVIGALIALWIVFGKEGWKKLNTAAVFLLFALTVVLSFVVFNNSELFTKQVAGEMTFGAAIELSVIMPLSWLPLIADYTRYARRKEEGAWGSWIGYFIGSCWMYVIGLGTAITVNNADPSAMLLAANLGLVSLGIVILSTVTTTFLDAYSAGVTFLNIRPGLSEKKVAVMMTAVGTLLAIIADVEQYESFLYAIGSVFAPLFTIVLTDYFVLNNRKIQEGPLINWGAVVVWAVGVKLYYQFIKYDFPVGATIPVMIVTGIIYAATWKVTMRWKYAKKYQQAC